MAANEKEWTLIKDYSDTTTPYSQILSRLDALDGQVKQLTGIVQNQSDMMNRIMAFLIDNRDTYTKSLNCVSFKEDVMTKLLEDTKSLLGENRILYGQSFESILDGERQLRDLIKCMDRKTVKNPE